MGCCRIRFIQLYLPLFCIGTTAIVESYNTTDVTTVAYKSLTADTGLRILLIGGCILVVCVVVGSLWRVGFDGGRKKTRVKPRHAHVYVVTKKHSPLVLVHKDKGNSASKNLPAVLEAVDEVDAKENNVIAAKANGNGHTLAGETLVRENITDPVTSIIANANANGHTLAVRNSSEKPTTDSLNFRGKSSFIDGKDCSKNTEDNAKDGTESERSYTIPNSVDDVPPPASYKP